MALPPWPDAVGPTVVVVRVEFQAVARAEEDVWLTGVAIAEVELSSCTLALPPPIVTVV